MPNQKIFDQLLIFVNLYQHTKNEAISSICSGEIVDLKILQSDWLRAFWPISQEQDFSQNFQNFQNLLFITVRIDLETQKVNKNYCMSLQLLQKKRKKNLGIFEENINMHGLTKFTKSKSSVALQNL